MRSHQTQRYRASRKGRPSRPQYFQKELVTGDVRGLAQPQCVEPIILGYDLEEDRYRGIIRVGIHSFIDDELTSERLAHDRQKIRHACLIILRDTQMILSIAGLPLSIENVCGAPVNQRSNEKSKDECKFRTRFGDHEIANLEVFGSGTAVDLEVIRYHTGTTPKPKVCSSMF